MHKLIDIDFDFRSDTPQGKDPDIFSHTLRSYHKSLWSKKLPNSILFNLEDSKKDIYLYHYSECGEFFLSSDSIIQSFSRWESMRHITSQIKEEIEEFVSIGYTIGGMIIFPSNRVDGKNTINGARGFHPLIRDRIDLTLECIQRFYNNEVSPLTDVLNRHSNFFNIFKSFKNYIEFFSMQDLVSEDFSEIKFFMPFDNFKSPAAPTTIESYKYYKNNSINFVKKRNNRILESI